MQQIKILSQLAAISVTTLSLLLLVSPAAHADVSNTSTIPSFGTCPNPGGQQMASFTDGNHWIVGNSQLQWGKDSVFDQGNNNAAQCFCPLTVNDQPTGGLGTQTNWLFAGNMSSDEKQSLMNAGWLSVPDGSAFGLSSGPYLAKNSSFSCSQGQQVSCNTSITQQNSASIHNSVTTSTNTGNNQANENTGGNVSVMTGNATTTTTIQNNVNSNSLAQQVQAFAQQLRAQILSNGAFSINHISF